jgi:CheY-like chemotaxis protein
MTAKRALIVDDSKSARAFLSRILEKYDIGVETAESAEQAIEHLATHRPDVIFMDHLMPGMDGFQAVQLIKNNPRTATIPIMMYTSQEGELYLGQARALGAVGVLPKQIRPADVSKVLYQLKLVQDRRSGEQTSFHPLDAEAANASSLSVAPPASSADGGSLDLETTAENPPQTAPAQAAPLSPRTAQQGGELREIVESAMHAQIIELRQFVTMSLDDHAARTASDVRTLLLELPRTAPQVQAARAAPLPWVLACAGLAAAIAFGALWSREMSARQGLEAKLAQLAAAAPAVAAAPEPVPSIPEVGSPPAPSPTPAATGETLAVPGEAAVPAALATPSAGAAPPPDAAANPAARPSAPPPVAASTSSTPVASQPVPYGEVALAGPRLEMLRTTFTRLATQGFRGQVDVRTYSGRFCLVGNASDGFTIAPEELPASKCDLVGNPHDEALPAAQREPSEFTDLVGSFRQSTGNAADVRIVSGEASSVTVPYPSAPEKTTAGEWNRAALANNRVEVRLRPAH